MEESKSLDLKTTIINAAVALFLKHGYIGTTLEDISAAVGISRNSFYKFFLNKEQLLGAILRGAMHEVERSTDHIYSDDSIPYTERIRMLLESVSTFFARLRAPYVLRDLQRASPALWIEFETWRRNRSLKFRHVLQSGLAEGNVTNEYGLNEMMNVYTSMFSHCMDFTLQAECDIHAHELYTAFMNLYLFGLADSSTTAHTSPEEAA